MIGLECDSAAPGASLVGPLLPCDDINLRQETLSVSITVTRKAEPQLATPIAVEFTTWFGREVTTKESGGRERELYYNQIKTIK